MRRCCSCSGCDDSLASACGRRRSPLAREAEQPPRYSARGTGKYSLRNRPRPIAELKTTREDTMIDRRTFATLLAGAVAAPKVSLAQGASARNVFYASTGPELTLYSVDVEDAALIKRNTVSTPV